MARSHHHHHHYHQWNGPSTKTAHPFDLDVDAMKTRRTKGEVTTHGKIFDEKPRSTEVFATAVPAGLTAPK